MSNYRVKAGVYHRTAAELLVHLEKMKARGVDLKNIDCWGWDDESVIFDDPENLYPCEYVKHFERKR